MFFPNNRIARIAGTLLSLGCASTAFAFEPMLDDTFELQATRAFATSAGAQASAGYVDARVKTGNTASEELDQRYVGTARADVAYSPGPAVSFRAFVRALYSDALRQDSLSTDRKVTEKGARANGALDASFAAAQGIEVFVGSSAVFLAKAKKEVRLASVKSDTTYTATTLYAPRLGLLKRTGAFAAGLFYSVMTEQKRRYTRVTGVESEDGSEYVTLPSMVGATARFTPGSKDIEIELALALVQMGDSEEKTEQGAPLARDSYRLHVGGLFPLVSGALSLYAAVSHRTLSYNDQGFMTMENIPHTRLELLAVTAPAGARFFAGLLLDYGSDSQSIPELNAQFTYKSYALKCGFDAPM